MRLRSWKKPLKQPLKRKWAVMARFSDREKRMVLAVCKHLGEPCKGTLLRDLLLEKHDRLRLG